MDQQDEKHSGADTAPAQTPAAEEAAAQKREEAVRRVEEMLASQRRQNVETELNMLSALSRHPKTYVVKSGKEDSDPMTGLLQYRKPEKPQEEMTPEELDAEQKREAAIRKVNAMMIRQRGKEENLYRSGSVRTVYLPKARKAVEKNSVDIAGFLSQYKLSPEAQARFEEIRYGGAKKGTVRPALLVRFATIAAPPMLLFIAWVLGQYQNMSVTKPLFLILALLILLGAYYVNTWKLEFDSNSEFVRYHSMFHGTNLYEMKELMNFVVSSQPEKPFPLSLLGILDPRQYLVIRLPEHTINIPLLYSTTVLTQRIEVEGYEGAGDLCRCLEQFERDLYKKAASDENKAVSASKRSAAPEKPAPVQSGDADGKITLQKKAAEQPAPEPRPVPKPDPVDPAKAREMFAKPAASSLSMPDRSGAFPDPAGSAFPDPAQKPKPDVDVDALFNQVLREHGKLK